MSGENRDLDHGKKWIPDLLNATANALKDAHEDVMYWHKKAMEYRVKHEETLAANQKVMRELETYKKELSRLHEKNAGMLY